jgi:hypothetical protein
MDEEGFSSWFKENTPKEGLSENTTFTKQFLIDAWNNGFLTGLEASRPKWYKLSEKYPDADKLVRVRLMSGMEHICETCFYEPTEDEIGYGKLVINFYELNGEWVDDNDIITWCEIPKYTED